jgi:hypothetical protein
VIAGAVQRVIHVRARRQIAIARAFAAVIRCVLVYTPMRAGGRIGKRRRCQWRTMMVRSEGGV